MFSKGINEFINTTHGLDILICFKKNVPNVVLFDSCNLKLIMSKQWYIMNTGYCYTHIRSGNKDNHVSMHHFLLDLHLKPKGNKHVDHINGNRLDNRIENLRICSSKTNLSKKSTNKSGYPGVYMLPSGRWRAIITQNYKWISLGTFTDLEDAINARKKSELELRGELSIIG